MQGAGIVIVFWHIIFQRGFDGGAGIREIILEEISLRARSPTYKILFL